jgi:ubiquitin carboxyl-terminal hydrolase 14
MPAFNVTVKWGRETFKDVECNTDEEPGLFKAQLYALTHVAPNRQKIMIKGKTLSDHSWENFPIVAGMTVLLMGTKEDDIQDAPVEQVKFVEDMNEMEFAAAMELPIGLANLGNTCYMNATVQCLKTVPELANSLQKFSGGVGSSDSPMAITAALRDLYRAMDKKVSIPPIILLQAIHTAFPRFAERGEHGVWVQQDANECWTEIMRMLQQKLPTEERNDRYNSIIDQYFGGRLSIEWKCDEAPEEAVTVTEEDFLQLSCFIAPETKYLHSGLKNKLEETGVIKNSVTLNRDASYTKSAKVDRLPAYLSIQMVRFFYKGRIGKNAKIVKDVKFPLSFDMFDLCTKQLQDKLTPMRTKFKEVEDWETENKLANKDKDSKESKEVAKTTVPYSFQDDVGSNNSGFYELRAILTHKGRTSDSGHYVAWIKHKDDIWLKCDDDVVTAVTSEEVLKLSGGGDWHCAYVLLYGPKVLHLPEGQSMIPVFYSAASPVEGEKMSTE